MYTCLKLLFSCFFSCLLFAFTIRVKQVLNAKEIEKDFISISNNLLVNKYEVSNGDYKKFLSYLKEANQELYNQCIWDTAQWEENIPLRTFYHAHRAYNNYPAVTISYDAANAYCQWLTEQYHLDINRKYKKVVFRLPTEQEWIQAANGGNKNKMYPWGNYYLRNRKGEFLCNFLHLGDQSITYDEKTKSYKVVSSFGEGVSMDSAFKSGLYDRALFHTSVQAFDPNEEGFYNLSGNAAEMVAEKGLAKGGSYNDPGYDVRISSRKRYEHPSPEIGFRVAMEIIEK